MRLRSTFVFGVSAIATSCLAQQPIAYVPTQNVSVSGSLSVENGRASIGNNGTITANVSTAHVTLARGGDLRVCASTKVNLSRDSSLGPNASNDSALMIALDRGAIEANYTPGKYSDVLLTPDLRVLISGPGKADLKVRVNNQGDTCIDNAGAEAPYVTVTSQFEDGVYRVQPNQRVMFEHGSLQQVVDNEKEPCGCPTPMPVSVADAAAGITTNHANPAHPGEPLGGPSSTPADTEFPLAVSEGLQSPPAATSVPVVPIGTPHAEVTAPISYNASETPNPSTPEAAGKEPVPEHVSPRPSAPKPQPATAEPRPAKLEAQTAPPAVQPATEKPVASEARPAAPPKAQSPQAQTAQQDNGSVFHHISSFFARLFGR